MKPALHLKSQGGFSLVELLIVLTIIGILAAVGIPQYQKYIYRAKTAEAQAALRGILLEQQAYRAKNTYFAIIAAADKVGKTVCTVDAAKNPLQWLPPKCANSAYEFYVLGDPAANPVKFVAIAKAINSLYQGTRKDAWKIDQDGNLKQWCNEEEGTSDCSDPADYNAAAAL